MDKKTVDFMLRISFFLSIILAVCSCHLSVVEPYECVDPFIGTAGDCGQMDPSATIPFSMIKVGPDAVKKSHVGYDYNQTAISGFSINRTSGVGCTGSGGNINIRPADNSVLLKICKNKEVAKPGLYTATLSNGVVASMTCTERIAYEEFVYPQGQDRNLFINFASTFGGIRGYEYRVSGNTIEGKISNNATCKLGVYSFYFVVEISDSFKILSQTAEDILLQLNATENTAVTVRVAVSPISVEDCYKELQDEERTFQQVYEDARVLWTDLLGRIQVYGGTDEQRIMFYTSLYRTLLSPVNVTTSSGQFRNSKGEIQDADGFTYYSSWSIWDTYRTKFPLMVLMNLDNLSDIGNSLLVHYINGKTIWSTEHEVTPTTRTDHAPIVLLDMMAKGIKLDYLEEAYPYIVAEVESEPLNSPDQYLETAYDYWALAQIALRLGKSDDAEKYALVSDTMWSSIWKKYFQTIDEERFDIMHGDGLYEGTLWQYRWAVPFSTDKLIELDGGPDKFVEHLSYFFENNLYNHGNQPDIHAAFLFNKAGRPDLTRRWVKEILTQPMIHRYGTHDHFDRPYYGKAYNAAPEAYIPEMDDDDGTMSAWYVLASMGLYPLTPGTDQYEICEPLFDKVVIDMGNHKNFTIRKKSIEGIDHSTCGIIELNGKEITQTYIHFNNMIDSELTHNLK